MLVRNILLVYTALLFVVSCSSDQLTSTESLDQIIVHLEKEPQRLNPILQTISEERIVTEHMFLSLCDYDPISGEWVPVLTTEMPKSIKSKNERGGSITTVEVEIVPEAVWADGSPVTAHDFEMTMKMALLPRVNSPSWKAVIGDLAEIRISTEDPKVFSIVVTENHFKIIDALLTAEILPKHIYDSYSVLDQYTYQEIKSIATENLDSESSLIDLAKEFGSAKFSRDPIIEGVGAYRLKQWQTGQFIVLERQENWWGDKYPSRTLLAANAKRIIYQIISDPTVALTQLRSNQIDVMSLASLSSQVFLDLKQDSEMTSDYRFYNPQLPRIYYVLMNNQGEHLSDVNVRKALAHCMDVDRLIDQQEKGLGDRLSGPFSPLQPGYLSTLKPIQHDINQAKSLLSKSGWEDEDGDGIRERDGKKLNLRFFITGSALSTAISTLLKEEALKAGFNIELITKSSRASRQENLIPGDFELSAQAITSEGKTDPYLRFHTSAMGANGLNWGGYSNAKVDELLETIRFTEEDGERMKAYREFQQQIYEDQPMIFLYAPVEKFVVSSKYDPVISSKRPGFFVNAFTAN